jgi:putative DNA primase/helicase
VRFIHTLHDRLFLAGYGWHVPDDAGQPLERSLVDRVVGGPERIVYEGAPVLLTAVLRQDHVARAAVAFEGGVLDTREACPPLSADETARLRQLRGLNPSKSPARALTRRMAREDHFESFVGAGNDAINARLKQDPETWVRALLGEPTSKDGDDWRYGTRGSLRVSITGSWAGMWNDFEQGEAARQPFDLVAREKGSAEAAREWLVNLLGDAPSAEEALPAEEVAAKAKAAAQERTAALELTNARKVAVAHRLVMQCIPVAGTLGETYLTKTRKIPKRKWPNTILFHPESQCLLVVAETPDGETAAVQRIVLTPDGRKATADEAQARGLPAPKFTQGVKRGAVVTLPGLADSPVQVVEGPEDGLTAWAATGYETHIALGGLGDYIPRDGYQTILCIDRDADDAPSTIALNRGVARMVRAGCDVVIATPYDEFKDKNHKDFNDLLRKKGLPAVKRRILEPQRAPAKITLDVATARTLVKKAVRNETFVSAALTKTEAPVWPARKPPALRQALRATTGTGKTGAARDMVVETLRTMRAAGDQRTAIIAVPTLVHGQEQLENFNTEFSVGLWRGRGAPDPNNPEKRMCRDLDLVKETHVLYLDAQSTCCWSRKGQCQFFDHCGYQAQRRERHDVWIVAHELLVSKRPDAIGEPAFIFADESFWEAGLQGISGIPIKLPLTALGNTKSKLYQNLDRARPLAEKPTAAVTERQKKFAKKMGDTGRRRDPFVYLNVSKSQILQAKMLRAIHEAPDGPLTRQAVIDGGLTSEDANAGYKLVWDAKVDPKIHPGMPAAARKKAIEAAQGNRVLGRLEMMWLATMLLVQGTNPAEASGWASLGVDKDQRVLILKGRRPIQESWHAPIMHLDATLDSRLLPGAEIIGDINVDAPHQYVRQVVDEAFSKSSLTKEKSKKLEKVLGTIHTLAARYAPEQVLCVMQMDVEELLKDRLPDNVTTAHHNNVAGRDEWRDVRALIVIGSTRPTPKAVEALAGCLRGRVIPPVNASSRHRWYEPRVVERTMRDGRLVYGIADHHPHPIAEAIRAQICESELMQIIGRARGINRTEKNPIDIWILAGTPLPVVVDEIVYWADLVPGPREHMLAAGGFAFESPGDAAAAYPALFRSRTAAAMGFARSGCWSEVRHIHYRVYSSVVNVTHLTTWAYLKAGPGRRPACVWTRRGAFADAEAVRVALEALLGPIKSVWPGVG